MNATVQDPLDVNINNEIIIRVIYNRRCAILKILFDKNINPFGTGDAHMRSDCFL